MDIISRHLFKMYYRVFFCACTILHTLQRTQKLEECKFLSTETKCSIKFIEKEEQIIILCGIIFDNKDQHGIMADKVNMHLYSFCCAFPQHFAAN